VPPSSSPSPTTPQVEPRLSGAGAVAFVVELAMLVLLALAGWRLGGNAAVSVLLAVVLVAVAVVVWGRWLAPRTSRRLPRTPRLAAKALLFAATGGLTAVSGLVGAAVVFVVVAAASLVWARD